MATDRRWNSSGYLLVFYWLLPSNSVYMRYYLYKERWLWCVKCCVCSWCWFVCLPWLQDVGKSRRRQFTTVPNAAGQRRLLSRDLRIAWRSKGFRWVPAGKLRPVSILLTSVLPAPGRLRHWRPTKSKSVMERNACVIAGVLFIWETLPNFLCEKAGISAKLILYNWKTV